MDGWMDGEREESHEHDEREEKRRKSSRTTKIVFDWIVGNDQNKEV